MINYLSLLGTHDILFITLDTLRYDVAQKCHQGGRTPNFKRYLKAEGWEQRHSPGSFTYSAHHAFFAGFFPTPVSNPKHPRPFALAFPGSESISAQTCTFDTADIVSGFAGEDYKTICIGGVGFFNKLSPLGTVLPNLFHESHWSPDLGVTSPSSTENQVRLAIEILNHYPMTQRLFMFLNISAIHQPNCIFCKNVDHDNMQSHAAALEYVDREIKPLFEAFLKRAPVFCIICSDHGTAYGEDGLWGHRAGHSVVYSVPYAEFILSNGI